MVPLIREDDVDPDVSVIEDGIPELLQHVTEFGGESAWGSDKHDVLDAISADLLNERLDQANLLGEPLVPVFRHGQSAIGFSARDSSNFTSGSCPRRRIVQELGPLPLKQPHQLGHDQVADVVVLKLSPASIRMRSRFEIERRAPRYRSGGSRSR